MASEITWWKDLVVSLGPRETISNYWEVGKCQSVQYQGLSLSLGYDVGIPLLSVVINVLL